MTTPSTPEGYHSLTPYLAIEGASRAIEFYRQAFGATELFRFATPDGRIGHAELAIGDSRIMLSDGCSGEGGLAHPRFGAAVPVGLYLYVDDVDAVFARALQAGATAVRPVQDQFYGDRSGTLADPFGHVWFVATHVEDVAPEEFERRAEALHRQDG
ncbi:VOC family protein [Nitrosovibrio sp. Nv17]|jgi:PhnB protein|uniref:VOC family protein n=1 Tax=Nitrosovibrio sp. Nv17 TaxID=1855339 RepID=UPI000908D6A6|nr:VOC family protein [Nitrosovibrio sp. Nv17]SFW36933.1 PhnB protein [Nitrosovibrio sp. Nv17]